MLTWYGEIRGGVGDLGCGIASFDLCQFCQYFSANVCDGCQLWAVNSFKFVSYSLTQKCTSLYIYS